LKISKNKSIASWFQGEESEEIIDKSEERRKKERSEK